MYRIAGEYEFIYESVCEVKMNSRAFVLNVELRASEQMGIAWSERCAALALKYA